KIAQQWIKESGREISRLKGGYKAFRSYLLGELEEFGSHFNPIILGGRTGSGKTIELKKLSNAIDLEALANHRGSSFGQKVTPQTSQINFDNNLAYELITKREEGHKKLVFEDEGKHVGSVFMPQSLVASMADAPLVILERPMQERIAITLEEYVVEAQKAYRDAGFEDGWEQNIQNSIKRIQRRLGNQRYEYVNRLFEEAFKKQKEDGSLKEHEKWIEYLLREYYDPMYDYQIQKRSERVAFRGNEQEVQEYILSFSNNAINSSSHIGFAK
ncbi:MAG: tRNA 2-selenouridine(34) synthase MnmH, partial [Sulfurimonas sp.]